MLHIQDALLIGSPLFLLVPSVAGISGRRAVRGGLGVKDPDVKVGASFAFVPEVFGPDV